MFETIFLKLKNDYRKLQIKIYNKWNKNLTKLPKEVTYYKGGLYDAVYESALKYPFNTALEYQNTQISYKSLIKKINKVARALKAFGVKKGDKVTICMPNTPEEVYMFYAINEIGAVANMVHPLSSEKEFEYYLNKSETKIVLCIDASFKKIYSILNKTKVQKVIVASATKSMERIVALLYYLKIGRKLNIKESSKVITWDHFLLKANEYEADPYEQVSANDPAVILYSGGTTGKSKGVVISNYSFNAQALQSRYVSDALVPDNAFLTFLPNFHAFGIGICTHTPLYNGMRVVLIPQFNAKKFKSYIRKYHFNILCGVPTLYDYISKMDFKKNELKDLKLVVCGGDAISLPLKKKVNEFLKKYGCKTELRVGYGLTESSGVVALSPENVKNESDVIGYAFPDAEFIIMDINTGKEANIGKDGEICISGPNVMLEYLGDPLETNETLFKGFGNKIWLHTGDIGYFDNKGLLHYKSRLKRMIITSGYNVYPSQVEEVINSYSAVKNCAVIGVPDSNKGQIVKAFVVLKEDKNNLITKASLQKHIKEHLAKYECPRETVYIEELPVTKLGKIAYKELEKLK